LESDPDNSNRNDADPEAPVLSIFQEPPDIVPFQFPGDPQHDQLLEAAFTAEDEGELQLAIDYCHAILARDGPRAEIDFQLGELLYRCGETVAARERYYAAIEDDPEFVEARVSLGCVLQETGQGELAVAAFRGALSLHDDYPEAHYHLARLLDELDRGDEAREHWSRFRQLAPESPWAEEAMQRIEAADDH
jgi:tetratricopeptide (TPR) repeat protein